MTHSITEHQRAESIPIPRVCALRQVIQADDLEAPGIEFPQGQVEEFRRDAQQAIRREGGTRRGADVVECEDHTEAAGGGAEPPIRPERLYRAKAGREDPMLGARRQHDSEPIGPQRPYHGALARRGKQIRKPSHRGATGRKELLGTHPFCRAVPRRGPRIPR